LQQRKDPQVLEEQQQAVNERMQAILQKAQSRLGELVWFSAFSGLGY
jgi:outer membrane protein insertion porin family